MGFVQLLQCWEERARYGDYGVGPEEERTERLDLRSGRGEAWGLSTLTISTSNSLSLGTEAPSSSRGGRAGSRPRMRRRSDRASPLMPPLLLAAAGVLCRRKRSWRPWRPSTRGVEVAPSASPSTAPVRGDPSGLRLSMPLADARHWTRSRVVSALKHVTGTDRSPPESGS